MRNAGRTGINRCCLKTECIIMSLYLTTTSSAGKATIEITTITEVTASVAAV